MTKIQQDLFALADAGYKHFQSALIPTVDPETVIGVRIPLLRTYAKTISKEDAAAFMKALPHEYYEENNLHAFLIERIADFDACAFEVDRFLPYVDNWATCDSMRPKVFAKEKERLFEKCREWIASDHPYTIRYGLEMLMLHGLDDAFEPAFLELAASVRSEEYYVRMMVAWFFATALTKRYDETLPYIQEHRLEEWVHRKAIQKACESRVIPTARKTELKALKG